MSKAKGSRYENELIKVVQEHGLSAVRTPLSGAVKGYDNDVVIADTFRIESKFSKTASGFKAYQKALDEDPSRAYILTAELAVLRLELLLPQLALCLAEKPASLPWRTSTSKRSHATALKHLDQGEDKKPDFVACRSPRQPWIAIVRVNASLFSRIVFANTDLFVELK